MRKRRQPGQLEDSVLDVLWSAGEALAAASIFKRMLEEGNILAYTTLTTTIVRLHEKGLLTREPHSRGFVYRPTAQAADDAAQRMHDLLGGGIGRQVVLSRFVATLSPGDEAALLSLLHGDGLGQGSTGTP